MEAWMERATSRPSGGAREPDSGGDLPGDANAPAFPGESNAPALPGGSNAPALPGGSNAPALPGGAAGPGTPGLRRLRLRRVAAAAGGAGAVALPGWHVGVGWFVAAAAVAAVAAVAHLDGWFGRNAWVETGADRTGSARTEPGRADRAWRTAAGVAALALAAVPTVRAAGWLAAVCLLAALPLGSYALVGGTGWRTLGPSFVALPRCVPAAVGWLAQPSGHTGSHRWRRVLAAIGVGTGLVLVFGLLFRAADPRFAALVDDWTRDVRPGLVVRWGFGFVLVTALATGAAYLVHKGQSEPDDAPPPEAGESAWRSLSAVEWGVPLGMLIALFATFVRLQLDTLFGGRAYVMNPDGPDFAEYARTGFVLLAAVTALTLAVVAVLAVLADRTQRRDRILLRVLGGTLCGLTLVIVASALDRMHVYVAAYGFTGQRIAGYAAEVWLGLLFVLVLAAGWRLRAAWLPRATVAAAVMVLLAVVAVNPDALMARTHADRITQDYPLDHDFLASLSADAAAELAKLPPVGRTCPLDAIAADLEGDDPWYRFNLGRARARTLVDRERATGGCR
jgi:hypothetical protein